MYRTHINPDDAPADLLDLDDALLRLRRLWTAPPPALVLEEGDGEPVTLSSVLVVEACARAEGEVGVGEVGRFLDVEHSTASRLVDRAVRGGLVERTASEVDARRVALRLTPSGQALRERAVGFRIGWLGHVLADWDAADVQALAQALTRFAEAITKAGPPGSTAG
jgi:DNA-binding MarR family transcriptional regulator